MADDAAVNPAHYDDMGDYAPIYVIEKWKLGFEVGNAIKYIQRAGSKPGEPEGRDLEKAIWYLRRRLHLVDPEEYPDPAAEHKAKKSKPLGPQGPGISGTSITDTRKYSNTGPLELDHCTDPQCGIRDGTLCLGCRRATMFEACHSVSAIDPGGGNSGCDWNCEKPGGHGGLHGTPITKLASADWNDSGCFMYEDDPEEVYPC